VRGWVVYRYIWLARPVVETVQGWRLGSGVDVSNPELTTRVSEIILEKDILDLGFLSVGSPKSGKTMSSGIGYMHYLVNLEKEQQKPIGFCWSDGKGNLDVYQAAEAAGIHFDRFFSSELPHSHTTNIFEGDAEDVIDRSIRVLINETEGSGQFYADEQRKALNILIRLVKSLDVNTSYQDLFVAFTVEGAAFELLKRAKESDVDLVDYHLAEQWLAQDMKTRVNQISGMLNRLFLFVTGPTAERLNDYDPDIVFSDAIKTGQKLYFHLPLTKIAKDIGILFTEMWGVEARKRQQEGNMTDTYPLLFDDWGGFFHDNVGAITARIRSAQMPPSYSFQDDSYLDEVTPTFKKQLENNIAVKMLFRLNGSMAAHDLAPMMGEYHSTTLGVSDFEGRDGVNFNTMLQPRIDHDDLLSLNKGQAYVMTINERSGQSEPGYYCVQFPLVEMHNPQSIHWPKPEKKRSRNGLGFWDRYMNPEEIAKIQQAVKDALLDQLKREEAMA